MAFGTLFSLDAVAEDQTTVPAIGEDTLWDNLDAYFAAHNRLFQMVLEQVAETTTDRIRWFGGTDEIDLQELDEFGSADVQKIDVPGYNIGFPMRMYGSAIGWTRFALEVMTAAQFSRQVNAITDADERAMYRELRRAIFRPTNYTVKDRHGSPQIDLDVKAFVNGDGLPIPVSPNNQTFDGSTHTHYLGVTTGGSPQQSEHEKLIETVAEHFTSGSLFVYINKADEVKVRGFTDFKEYIDARLVDQRAAVVVADGGSLDTVNYHDRAIGLLHGAEYWVKPWIPSGYAYAFITGPAAPLVHRVPEAGPPGLRLMADNERYPLRAREWSHRFGIAVGNRLAGAVLDMNTGSGTYTQPTIT